MTDEKRLERKLEAAMKEIDGFALKFPAFFNKGFPDRICLFPGGIVVFVEVKKPGGKLERMQEYWRDRLTGWGFTYYKLDTDAVLQDIMNHAA